MEPLLEHLPLLADAGLVVLLSGLIGFEREARQRPAGLKTHMVVGLSAWLLVNLGLKVTDQFIGARSVTADPIRIVQAIIYGISFIGAGTIFQAGPRNRILGLTTAASLLATTSIAIAVGFGERILAAAVTAMILIVLVVFGAVERRLNVSKRDD